MIVKLDELQPDPIPLLRMSSNEKEGDDLGGQVELLSVVMATERLFRGDPSAELNHHRCVSVGRGVGPVKSTPQIKGIFMRQNSDAVARRRFLPDMSTTRVHICCMTGIYMGLRGVR